MTPKQRLVLQIVLPLAFLAFGAAGFAAMRARGAGTEQRPSVAPAAVVEVVQITLRDHAALVEGTGAVEAAKRVDLVPQVSGRVVWVAEGLAPGARFRRGDLLARIDARDYEAAVTQARAGVEAAVVELGLEEARGRQASREWELLGQQAPANPLTLRGPQLEAARARLASARAQLDQALAALERTRLVAPMDAMIGSESLEVGQLAAPGAPVATLLGTDRFRVRTSVPVRQVGWLDVPRSDGGHGSRAVITQALGRGRALRAEGHVSGMLGELEPQTRTATLLVVLPDPLALPSDQVPILPGAYVDVSLYGRDVPGIAEVPRVAMVGGEAVLVAGEGDRLQRREVEVAWTTRDHVYVSAGLTTGDRVIVSPLALPLEGMQLDVRERVADAGGEAP